MEAAGQFRHRVNIDERVVTRDSEGGETISWLLWAEDVPAAIAPVSGREAMVAGTQIAAASSKITIRWRPGVLETMRLRHGEVLYNIQAVTPDENSGRETLMLFCSKGASDGR